MHDTVEFEKRGIPATVFLTQVFKNAAVHTVPQQGHGRPPLIELPHPISNLDRDEMRALTLRYVDQMVRQLTA